MMSVGKILNTVTTANAIVKLVVLLLGSFLVNIQSVADGSAADFIEFDDQPLEQDLVLPEWFTLSFLELKNDLSEAAETGKRGLVLYFGQADCPYCKAHLEKNWGDRGIVTYTQKYFDVVAIDVRGDRPVVDVTGKVYQTEKAFAAKLKTDFTPSLLFYDLSGKEVLRLSGYHPPYQFRAALEYVADQHYLNESLRAYLQRGETVVSYDESELNESTLFDSPPYALGRHQVSAQMPMAVFFEQPTCHACNVLHAGPLQDKKSFEKFKKMDVIQLDINADTPVITPQGEQLTARQWARNLGIYYAPTLIFFSESGNEILRVDSVIRFYRLNGVLEYITSKAYHEYSTFQLWRHRKRK